MKCRACPSPWSTEKVGGHVVLWYVVNIHRLRDSGYGDLVGANFILVMCKCWDILLRYTKGTVLGCKKMKGEGEIGMQVVGEAVSIVCDKRPCTLLWHCDA
jgi:hypothetical protein